MVGGAACQRRTLFNLNGFQDLCGIIAGQLVLAESATPAKTVTADPQKQAGQ